MPGFLGTSEGDIHQLCEIPVNMLMWSWRRSSKAKKKLHHQSQPNRANAQPAVPNLLSDSSPLSSDFFFLTYFLPTYGLNCDSLFPFYHPLPMQSYDRWHTWMETARGCNRTLSESQQITQREHLLGVCSMTNGLEQALNV